MELRQLTYFHRVAETGSVSRAAALLHLTQPSLSRQIAALERELGHRLFDRTGDGMVLTAAGRGLHRHAEVIFAQVERIPEVVQTFSEEREIVRVGLPPGLPHEWFLELLSTAGIALPHLALSVTEASSAEQHTLVRAGLIDVALLHTRPADLDHAVLLTQDLGAAVPPGSPLAGRRTVRLADLDGLLVMAHAAGEVATEEARLRSAAAAAGVGARWIFRRFAEHSALIAASSGVDAVLMTAASAARHLEGWTWVPVAERDAAGERIAVVTWAAWGRRPRTSVRALVDLMVSTPWRSG